MTRELTCPACSRVHSAATACPYCREARAREREKVETVELCNKRQRQAAERRRFDRIRQLQDSRASALSRLARIDAQLAELAP